MSIDDRDCDVLPEGRGVCSALHRPKGWGHWSPGMGHIGLQAGHTPASTRSCLVLCQPKLSSAEHLMLCKRGRPLCL